MSKTNQQSQNSGNSQKVINFPQSYDQQYFVIKQQIQMVNKLFLQKHQEQFKQALQGGSQEQKNRYKESMEKRIKFLHFKILNIMYDKMKIAQELPQKEKKIVYLSPDDNLKRRNQEKMYVLSKAIKMVKSPDAPKPTIDFDLSSDPTELLQKIPTIKVTYDRQFSQPLEEEYKRAIRKSVNIQQKLNDLQFLRNMGQKSMAKIQIKFNSLQARPGFIELDKNFEEEESM